MATFVITLFVSRAGFYGNRDEAAMIVDEIYDSVSDVRNFFVKIHFSKNKSQQVNSKNMNRIEISGM